VSPTPVTKPHSIEGVTVRRLCLAICLSVAVAACGSTCTTDLTNPITACRSFSCAACSRLNDCEGGIDVNSCAQLLENQADCNTANCGTGTYSGTAAQQCLSDLKTQSCQDSENNLNPTSCDSTQGGPICPT
jgi:hypothetical protein